MRHDVEGSGVALLRVGKGEVASVFFGIDNYRVVETLTNEANGNFVQIEHNGSRTGSRQRTCRAASSWSR